jgi:hypothetical protein
MTPHRRSHYPRLDNLISWFVASIMVAASVIYAFKLQDERRKPATQRLPPRFPSTERGSQAIDIIALC